MRGVAVPRIQLRGLSEHNIRVLKCFVCLFNAQRTAKPKNCEASAEIGFSEQARTQSGRATLPIETRPIREAAIRLCHRWRSAAWER